MAKETLLVLLSVALLVASGDVSIAPEPISTTEAPITPPTTPIPVTTVAPTTPPKTTPVTPTTTTKPTPAPTTAPTSTTPTTTTTTTTTTTPPPPPPPITTTTSSPNTTTPAPTPTPKPKPGPEPQTGTWMITIPSTNRTCILLQLAASIDISYQQNASSSMEEVVLVLPKDANATGVCGDVVQNVTLVWNQDENSTNHMTFTFHKNGSTFDLESVALNLTMDKANFPTVNITNMILINENKEFATSVGHSYKCAKSQSLNLTEPSGNMTIGSIKISHVQIEAFMNKTGNTFGEANDCDGYETPDIVPIAVGCALAGLILIVLIAYLIGRRRNQARGYLSMVEESSNTES